MQKPCLLLIDIQNEYFQGGKSELVNPLEASLKARQLLDFFRQRQLPLVHIQHISTRPEAATFIAGTPGARSRRTSSRQARKSSSKNITRTALERLVCRIAWNRWASRSW